MKSEKEIREEIENTKKTIMNYKKAYEEGRIEKESFRYFMTDCNATIDCLKWVLGENDRYD